MAHIETQREEYKFKSTTIYEQQVINMADSKMAAEEVTATNTTAASGIANDDNGDHTYANVPAPAPAPANAAESTTAPNTAANSNEAAPPPPSSSTSTDNADGGASASDEPKPKVFNTVDFSFMLGLAMDDFICVTMIMSLFRTLLSNSFDEQDILHKILTIIKDARQQTAASSPPPPSTTTTSTST